MYFEVVGDITDIQTIAVGPSVRIRALLRKRYGGRRWRKLKGIATVRLSDGTIRERRCIGLRLTVLARGK
jgi:hypothetical protein